MAVKVDITKYDRDGQGNHWFYCPNCGYDSLDDSFILCPNCGEELEWSEKRERK